MACSCGAEPAEKHRRRNCSRLFTILLVLRAFSSDGEPLLAGVRQQIVHRLFTLVLASSMKALHSSPAGVTILSAEMLDQDDVAFPLVHLYVENPAVIGRSGQVWARQ